MWLATKLGFYSIVRKPDGAYHVRARTRSDLENLTRAVPSLPAIIDTPAGDYHFRLILNETEFQAVFAAIAASIDYSNFKREVSQSDQADKHSIYSGWWNDMWTYQGKAEKETKRGRPANAKDGIEGS